MVLCLDRAGLVGEDGATHHGAFDIAALRSVPNLTIASPMDEHELRNLMYTAQQEGMGPFVIRYPRGRGVLVDWRNELQTVKVGTGRRLKTGAGVAVMSVGPVGNAVAKAIAAVEQLLPGLNVAHYDMRFIKPLDKDLLAEAAATCGELITVEDGVRAGGFGSAVLEWLSDHGCAVRVTRLGLPDNFIEHGTADELRHIAGIDADAIADAIKRAAARLGTE